MKRITIVAALAAMFLIGATPAHARNINAHAKDCKGNKHTTTYRICLKYGPGFEYTPPATSKYEPGFTYTPNEQCKYDCPSNLR